jgi:hypothetical protein
VITDVSEKLIASTIRVKRITMLGTLAITGKVTDNILPSSLILFTLIMEARPSSETSSFHKGNRAAHPRRRHSSNSLFFVLNTGIHEMLKNSCSCVLPVCKLALAGKLRECYVT